MAGMKAVKEIFVYGPGPSSSHTIGPYNIAKDFREYLENKEVREIKATLFQSLAFTGRGHLTDQIIKKALEPYKVEVIFDTKTKTNHPNTLALEAFLQDGTSILKRYVSYGGGVFGLEGEKVKSDDIYPFSTFDELINEMAKAQTDDVFDILTKYEGKDLKEFGLDRLEKMFNVIEKGLSASSILPGNLKLKRVAGELNKRAEQIEDDFAKRTLLLSSFAYSTAEENASGDFIVTAPTCGSAGVVPAVLYYEYKVNNQPLEKLAPALIVGGMVGDFIKANASISGAVSGCQAEIGSATSMATASLCYLYNLSLHQIEYGAEVAMEHFLGLTCDPVEGYVQIPCIERNAMAAIHAYTAFLYAKEISKMRKNEVSFDNVVKAMKVTGDSLNYQYKETSLGGLAEVVKGPKKD
ncbi:MAG: L-serine ammonia-lyase, iron-sulfur-dependent, subunit alpha [Bacilli bacterium]|jgi:L-serine dehydratase|nr:L-serine ammonia-lyase, iron-sulfur-dependent, subunit alpha [Bacilli bacterium]